MSHATRTTVVVMLAMTAFVVPAFAGPIVFAPHRAAYDLALDPALASADVAPVSGRMVMELAGSSCEGYTSTVRFVTATNNNRGRYELTDTRSTTFESTDGFFRFDDQTFANNRLIERASGTVTRGPDGAVVRLTRPKGKLFTVKSGVAFPVEQLRTIVQAAIDGKRFLSMDVYDGADGGETVYATATVIGPVMTPGEESDAAPLIEAGVANMRSWPATISYFDKRSADSSPSFLMSLVLYENGIGRHLRIDQGDVVLLGTLRHLELLPVVSCALP